MRCLRDAGVLSRVHSDGLDMHSLGPSLKHNPLVGCLALLSLSTVACSCPSVSLLFSLSLPGQARHFSFMPPHHQPIFLRTMLAARFPHPLGSYILKQALKSMNFCQPVLLSPLHPVCSKSNPRSVPWTPVGTCG